MSGKVVLITGASSGLGEFIAYEYAKRDVSKVEECRKFVDDTIKHFGQLDHLVCNAGIGSTYSSTNDVTKFEPVMDINFWGSIYPTHFANPHLKKTYGKIIVNSSYAGLLHPANSGIYSASKAALISFFESLRFEVSPTITITILKLGFIQTNIITAKYLNDSVGSHLIGKDLVDVVPVMEVEPCTKAIVDGVCKGATSISEPRMMKATNPLNPGLLVAGDRFPGQHVARDKLQGEARRDTFPGDIPRRHGRAHKVSVKQLYATVEGFLWRHVAGDNDVVK
nr:glucose/ribitol dehydrogenase [Tanacetum cinerariifolium]